MAVVAVTPRYPMGVSRSNSQMRRIRDIAIVVIALLTEAARAVHVARVPLRPRRGRVRVD
jgi:hypothetical protein